MTAKGATAAGSRSKTQLFSLVLLLTGTSLAVYGQVITNAYTTHPTAQLIAWTKYAANFIISVSMWVLGSGKKKQPQSAPGRKNARLSSELKAVVLG